jgi:hypothetical protein
LPALATAVSFVVTLSFDLWRRWLVRKHGRKQVFSSTAAATAILATWTSLAAITHGTVTGTRWLRSHPLSRLSLHAATL